MAYQTEKLLILANTYPTPSQKYRETNCVAAINENGQLRRLFPIPYRLLDGNDRFHKWEWVSAPVQRATGDQRPESYRVDIDQIQRGLGQIPTTNKWAQRLIWLKPHFVESVTELEARRQATGETIGLLGPVRLLRLEIVKEAEPEWTEAELQKLSRDGLFDTDEIRNRKPLRKLPYRFYYHFEAGGVNSRHLITDWEAGTLYWNCVSRYGPKWEEYLRQKLETEFTQKDLCLLLGTVHRFPDIWLIISLIYPPKGALSYHQQLSMFD